MLPLLPDTPMIIEIAPSQTNPQEITLTITPNKLPLRIKLSIENITETIQTQQLTIHFQQDQITHKHILLTRIIPKLEQYLYTTL